MAIQHTKKVIEYYVYYDSVKILNIYLIYIRPVYTLRNACLNCGEICWVHLIEEQKDHGK